MSEMPNPNLNWIASYPKSGNTWVRMFLYQSMVQLGIIQAKDVKLDDVGRYIPADISNVFYEKVFGHSGARVPVNEEAEARLKVQSYFSQIGGGQLFIKSHAANGVIGGFPTLNPHLSKRGVYIIRNPLDVAVSYSHFLRLKLDDIVRMMNTANFVKRSQSPNGRAGDPMGAWWQNVESWSTVENYPIHQMKYEEMLADPRAEFSKLEKFFEFNLTDQQLSEAVEACSFKALQANEAKNGYNEKIHAGENFFRKGVAGEWRDKLSPLQVRALVRSNAREMNKHGYLTSDVLEVAGLSKGEALKAAQVLRKAASGAA